MIGIGDQIPGRVQGFQKGPYNCLVSSLRKAAVLVVEDDSALRAVYRAILKGAGYAVVAVEDGIGALQTLDNDELPNAVVLDLMLPRLSGSDVGRELRSRADTRDIPIIVVTCTDTTDIEGVDVDCFIRKPVPPERLIQAVEICTRKRSG